MSHLQFFQFTTAENSDARYEERNSTCSGLQMSYSTHRPLGPLRPPLHPLFPSAKSDVLKLQQKNMRSFKMVEHPGLLITDQQNFFPETKQEPEYVSAAAIICVSSVHTGGMLFSFASVFLVCVCVPPPPAGDEM